MPTAHCQVVLQIRQKHPCLVVPYLSWMPLLNIDIGCLCWMPLALPMHNNVYIYIYIHNYRDLPHFPFYGIYAAITPLFISQSSFWIGISIINQPFWIPPYKIPYGHPSNCLTLSARPIWRTPPPVFAPAWSGSSTLWWSTATVPWFYCPSGREGWSMAWFQGKFTGKPHILLENGCTIKPWWSF